jgi:hypothetical protein
MYYSWRVNTILASDQVSNPFSGLNSGDIPIVIFAYKRLDSLQNLITNLKENPESMESVLIIFIDGPKSDYEKSFVDDVHNFSKTIHGFKKVICIGRNINAGLSESVIQGVTLVLNYFECAIFLEDDLRVSWNFIAFMKKSLVEYQENKKVIAVSGYSYPLIPRVRKPYFLSGGETWSFGTWRDKWKDVEFDVEVHLKNLDNHAFKRRLDKYGFNFGAMLKLQQEKKIDSWGVRWWASAVLHDMYTLYPGEPLCSNQGFDLLATHTNSISNTLKINLKKNTISKYKYPDKVEEPKMIALRFFLMNQINILLILFNATCRRMRKLADKIYERNT